MNHRHAGKSPDVAVAIAAQCDLFSHQQALEAGAVGVVAIDAVAGGRWVDHRVPGLLRIIMAGNTEIPGFGLEKFAMRRSVTCMTRGTLEGDRVGVGACGPADDVFVAGTAELLPRCGQEWCRVRCVWIVSIDAIAGRCRRMDGATGRLFRHIMA